MFKSKTIAILGAGVMGSALIKAILTAKLTSPDQIIATDIDKAKLEKLSKELPIKTAKTNTEAVKAAHIIILSVKPQIINQVLEEISPEIQPHHLIISIAAGITTQSIEQIIQAPIIRVMPNIACQVRESISAISAGKNAKPQHLKIAKAIFKTAGEVVEVTENLMDAITGLSGSGPGYVYMFIEALADGGIKEGLPPNLALQLATQTVLGAAKLLKQTNLHPAELRNAVCSPAGTTITGIYELEKAGFRAAVMSAIYAATQRAKEL